MAIKNTNSRIGTVSNLSSKGTYDLLLLTYPDGFPEGQIKFGIDNTPRKITGVQKVAQIFMKTLLTTKGSDVIYPARGTNFSQYAVNANRITNDKILYSELIGSIKDAESQTKSSLNSNSSDTSSQLSQAIIAGIDVGTDYIVMYVQIITKDGVTAQVSVPFPETGLT